MIGFDDGTEYRSVLDGQEVVSINSNLTSAADVTQAKALPNNLNIGFMGDTKGGAFDITDDMAIGILSHPNPNGRPNSDVVVPWVNGLDLTRRLRGMWIIDFGVSLTEQAAAGYESPFEHVRQHVLPERKKNNRQAYREKWWLHVEPRTKMRSALTDLPRFIVTPTVAKHRLFLWAQAPTIPDHQLIAYALCNDCDMGILHSRVHETWGLRLGTRLETRPRYTPTTCFETFPFPEMNASQRETIAIAANEMNALRNNWLNPPEWTRTEVLEFPGSADGPWKRYIDPATVDGRGIGTVRYSRQVPKDADCATKLKRRTLTNLYNERPTWLGLAHLKLDEAVFAAYGWPVDLSDDELLARLLELNLSRAAAQ
jgi:type II restriction/modification system DNA methylase subunit YeeA